VICPKCSAARAHPSHRRGFVEHVAALFAFYPYRCHGCGRRFLERQVRAATSALQQKRTRRYFMLYGTLLLFLAVLYFFMTRLSSPPPDDDE